MNLLRPTLWSGIQFREVKFVKWNSLLWSRNQFRDEINFVKWNSLSWSWNQFREVELIFVKLKSTSWNWNQFREVELIFVKSKSISWSWNQFCEVKNLSYQNGNYHFYKVNAEKISHSSPKLEPTEFCPLRPFITFSRLKTLWLVINVKGDYYGGKLERLNENCSEDLSFKRKLLR